MNAIDLDRKSRFVLLTMAFAVSCLLLYCSAPLLPSGSIADADEVDDEVARDRGNDPATVMEARGRARILHETIHGALQVMHRDFFREDEGLKIPSRSLEDVFSELTRSYGVKVNWIAVSTDAMNIHHKPRDEFEKNAVRALKSGKQEFEAIDNGSYQRAGLITLSSQCLKCHLSSRTSNKARAAGLVIRMPLKNK